MAREYAKVKLGIWTDPDFREVSAEAQRLYFLLLTSGSLNACGVADWRESRLVHLCSGSTAEALQRAAWELGQKRLIAVDPDTEEVLVRSFVRHDGVLKSPNMTTAMVKDYGTIASQKLMKLVSFETRRAFAENPDWSGATNARPVSKQFPDFDGNDPEMVPNWFQNGSLSEAKGFPNGSAGDASIGDPDRGEPFENGSPIPQPTTITPSYEGGMGGRPSDEPDTSAASVDAAPKKRKGTRLSEDWQPNPEATRHRKMVDQRGEAWVANQFERFQNHWISKAGRDAVKIDWDRAWSGWLLKAEDFDPAPQQADSSRSAIHDENGRYREPPKPPEYLMEGNYQDPWEDEQP